MITQRRLKAHVTQVQGETLVRLHKIGGLQDMHNKYHLYDVHRACASYSIRHMYHSFFFSFPFSIFFFFFFFLFFTCLFLVPTTIQDYYMRQRPQCLLGIYKVSNVHSPSNHKRNQSQQVFVARKDSGVHKRMQVGRSRGMFIPFVDDLHPLLLDSALLTEFGWSRQHKQRG